MRSRQLSTIRSCKKHCWEWPSHRWRGAGRRPRDPLIDDFDILGALYRFRKIAGRQYALIGAADLDHDAIAWIEDDVLGPLVLSDGDRLAVAQCDRILDAISVR